jgi:hypothetical protein
MGNREWTLINANEGTERARRLKKRPRRSRLLLSYGSFLPMYTTCGSVAPTRASSAKPSLE